MANKRKIRKADKTKEVQKVIERRKESFFKSNYKKSWQFLRESKKYIIIITLLLIASVFLGYFFRYEALDNFLLETIKGLAEKTINMNTFQLFIFILQNNLKTAFWGMLLGFFLGIFPVIAIIFNGYLLGFVIQMSLKEISYTTLLKLLLPHGIFELVAVVIAMSIGIRFGATAFARTKNIKQEFLYRLENLLRIFIFIVLPLLLIAAIIETSLIFILK